MYCMVAEYCPKSKQTNVVHSASVEKDWIWRCKESKSIKHTQAIRRDYGIVGASFIRTGLENQQSLVHASSDRSNEGNQAEHGLVLSGL